MPNHAGPSDEEYIYIMIGSTLLVFFLCCVTSFCS